jgi:AhpD family alkylhydroperoxidase
MKAVNAPGALDAKTKRLINLALSVVSKCQPCIRIHTDGALEAGATEEEIAEAAALGISFGSATVSSFYNSLRSK